MVSICFEVTVVWGSLGRVGVVWGVSTVPGKMTPPPPQITMYRPDWGSGVLLVYWVRMSNANVSKKWTGDRHDCVFEKLLNYTHYTVREQVCSSE